MKISIIKGLSFGLASGIVTTLGLMVGLYSGTHNASVILAGILTIALADAPSDAFGIHMSEESSNAKSAEVWETTVATFVAKLVFALTFIIPVFIFDLGMAVIVSIAWGLFLLTIISVFIAKWRDESKFSVVAEHWLITIFVVAATYGVGLVIDHYFPVT
jgi:VIT1/CCC1 family predicted Fe2+/Mn2+ transporter